ncbi:protein ACCELERATED CELL DEATH 6-like [Panicum miliaceum]|uniref:Protein ACCELERATED CELL DEATH 6-like n=1 Tax=Panicum miliaceum TaxID=4540 RepID=A0A3L6T403_PANMI|nr:protein ACCELERATED CELL DEATH 6-like [Panicum miliaceum]
MAARHNPHTMEHRLLKAVATGDTNLLEQVLGSQSSATAEQGEESCLKGVTAEGSSALHIAASCGYLELVKMVCAQDISLIKARNNMLDTPLICAARAGHVDVADYLMECAMDEQEGLRARNLDGETAMHEAVRNGHLPVLQGLMSRDSGLAAVVDENGVSPLYLAVASNRSDMVKVLIGEPLNDVSYSGPDGQTALHAAVYVSREISESLQCWKETLSREVDGYGRTALHYAALVKNLGPVKLLLANSSLAFVPDNEGLYPVHIAAIAGNVNVVCKFMEICLNYDELLDNKRRNILHCAVEHGRVQVVCHICRSPKFVRMMNARDGEGNTPLHLAVKHGRTIIFSFLMMDARVNLNIMNNEGLTPLDVAFSKIHTDYTFSSFANTSIITCLTLCEASGSPWLQARNLSDNWCSEGKKEPGSYANVSQSILYISVFIVVGSLAAACTPPGGYIAEGKDAGKPVFGGRTGFWIFVIANSMSFYLSTTTIFLFVFARLTRHRRFYLILSAALVFGAVLSMVMAFVTVVGLTLDPANSWDESILIWLVSNLAFPICLRVAMQLWVSKHRWQDISKVVAQAILLIYVVRALIITMQSLVKSVLPGRHELCSWPGCVVQGDAVVYYPT